MDGMGNGNSTGCSEVTLLMVQKSGEAHQLRLVVHSHCLHVFFTCCFGWVGFFGASLCFRGQISSTLDPKRSVTHSQSVLKHSIWSKYSGPRPGPPKGT